MEKKFELPKVKQLPVGLVISEPGSSRAYKTGEWRTFRPTIDQEKCTNCGFCWVYCPDASISITEEGNYEVNLDYCKGCGICAQECPVGAISMIKEKKR
jgi:pyruvate ferredoxin oxidoreductase delta subunit